MSDLSATNCGCSNCNSFGNGGNSCCSILIWIILLSCICGNGNGIGIGGNGCDEGCGNNCCLLILLLLFCGGGNGGFC